MEFKPARIRSVSDLCYRIVLISIHFQHIALLPDVELRLLALSKKLSIFVSLTDVSQRHHEDEPSNLEFGTITLQGLIEEFEEIASNISSSEDFVSPTYTSGAEIETSELDKEYIRLNKHLMHEITNFPIDIN